LSTWRTAFSHARRLCADEPDEPHGRAVRAGADRAFVATALGSLILERLLYRRLYGRDELDQVLLTMGLIFMSVAAATYVWGPLQQPMHPPRWLSGQVDFGFRSFPGYRSFLILCGAGLVIGSGSGSSAPASA
jgi:branched-subunit amino acid ABC-type transport system permease component